jgi:hypothetical protein
VAPSVDKVCKPRNGRKQRRREVQEKKKFCNKLEQKHGLQCSLSSMKSHFEMFPVRYKAKVHTKFVAYFWFLKSYSAFVLLNNFLYFICYLAAQQVPTYVKCFIFVHVFEAP